MSVLLPVQVRTELGVSHGRLHYQAYVHYTYSHVSLTSLCNVLAYVVAESSDGLESSAGQLVTVSTADLHCPIILYKLPAL